MNEKEPKTAQIWRAQQRCVGRYGGIALRKPITEDFTVPAIEAMPETPSKYEQLAIERYKSMVAALQNTKDSLDQETRDKLTGSSAMLHGYLVCGRVLHYLVDAYKEYLQKHDEDANITELQAMLHSDQVFKEFIASLSGTNNERNKIFEEAYGLVECGYKWAREGSSHTTFEIARYPDGRLYAFPNEVLEDQAISLTWGMDRAGEFQKCVAPEKFMRDLWTDICSAALYSPEHIPDDLAQQVRYGVEA